MTNLYTAQSLVAGHARELRSFADNHRRWRFARRAAEAQDTPDLRLAAAPSRTGGAAAESVAA